MQRPPSGDPRFRQPGANASRMMLPNGSNARLPMMEGGVRRSGDGSMGRTKLSAQTGPGSAEARNRNMFMN
jgi:hypothetical protein